MSTTISATPRRGPAGSVGLLVLLAAAMGLADGARAQTPACDQLKGQLAARIDASGVRGYSLETAPAELPVPPGARAIGNCEAGKFKVLYRRGAAAQPASGVADAAVPDAAADSADSAPAVKAAPKAPAPASAPGLVRAPLPRATARPTATAPTVSAAALVPVKAAASAAVSAPGADVVAVSAQVPPSAPDAGATVPLMQQAMASLAGHGRWLWALVLLPVAIGIWAWRAHRSAYDEAGLPRGPRL
jgi:hypothetical protein